MALVHLLVKSEINRGTIKQKSVCEECGADDRLIVAHHDDYARPLDVRWLCRVCHSNWHVRNGPGLNRHLAGFLEPGVQESQYGLHVEEMKSLRESGWTLQKIGDKFGFTREYVRQVVGPAPKKTYLSEIALLRMPEIIPLWNEGKKRSQISRLLGIAPHILRKLPFPPRVPPMEHGKIYSYTRHRCRCGSCRAANARKRTARNRLLRERGLCIGCKKPSTEWYCNECKAERKLTRKTSTPS